MLTELTIQPDTSNKSGHSRKKKSGHVIFINSWPPASAMEARSTIEWDGPFWASLWPGANDVEFFFSNRAFPLSITFITEIHCLRKLKLEGLGKEEKRVRGNNRKPTICACHQEQQIMGRKPAITQNCLQKLEKYRTYYSRTSPGQGQSTTNHQNKLQHPSPAKTQQYVHRRRCRAQHATHLQLQSRPSMFGAGGPHNNII